MPRNVLIIGSSGGLGNELARTFIEKNENIALHYFHNKNGAEKILQELRSPALKGNSFICRANLGNERSIVNLFKTIRKKWSQIHVIINNAGSIEDGLLSRMTESQWDRVIQINLTGLFFSMKYGGEIMKEKKEGHIINIASRSGITGRIGQANYSAAKAGVIGLTKSAAKEWGPDQIQVNTVIPGFLFTSIGTKMNEKKQAQLIKENVLQKPSTLEEVSRFVFFLSQMKYVSGQIFNLDSRII